MGATDQGVIGQSIRRKEDQRFLTGAGQYTDDVNPPGHVHAYFLRSPHAHAIIRRIDTAKAKAAPGVVAVYTGADLEGVNGLPCGWLITGTGGSFIGLPSVPVMSQPHGRPLTPSRSAPVKMATTPFAAFALAVSILPIFAAITTTAAWFSPPTRRE